VFRPGLAARMVLNRCPARSVIARETADALADHDPPLLCSRIGQRVVFAEAARLGQLAHEIDPGGLAAAEIAALANEIEALAL